MFTYLDRDDTNRFREYLHTEDEDLLVAGSKTRNRLERYLPESEYEKIRVILSAIVHDFKLPPVRYTLVIAVSVYLTTMEKQNVSDEVRNIAVQELALVAKHLLEDEREEFGRGMKLVAERWNEYLSDPRSFIL